MSKDEKALEGARLFLERAARQARFSLRALSRAIDRNPSYLYGFLYTGSPKALPEKERLHLAQLLEVNERELRDDASEVSELRQAAAAEEPQPATPRVPILSRIGPHGQMLKIPRERATEFADLIHDVDAGTAYALRIADPSLSPRFDVGDVVLLDPSVVAAPGSLVAVTRGDNAVTIGRLVEWLKERVELRQPDGQTVTLPHHEIGAIDKIIATHHR